MQSCLKGDLFYNFAKLRLDSISFLSIHFFLKVNSFFYYLCRLRIRLCKMNEVLKCRLLSSCFQRNVYLLHRNLRKRQFLKEKFENILYGRTISKGGGWGTRLWTPPLPKFLASSYNYKKRHLNKFLLRFPISLPPENKNRGYGPSIIRS